LLSGKRKGALEKRQEALREVLGAGGLSVEELVLMAIDVIKSGKLPAESHPFANYLFHLDNVVQDRDDKRPTAKEWKRMMEVSVSQLKVKMLSDNKRIDLMMEMLSYIFPKRKAVDHSFDADMFGAHGVLVVPAQIAQAEDWAAQAMRQQAELEAKAKEVSSG
jgi:hypothetical protein